MPQYRYFLIEGGGSPDFAIEFESTWGAESIEYVAEDAAKHGYAENDLWECNWPLSFVILDMDGKELGRASVELDHDPTFSATAVEA